MLIQPGRSIQPGAETVSLVLSFGATCSVSFAVALVVLLPILWHYVPKIMVIDGQDRNVNIVTIYMITDSMGDLDFDNDDGGTFFVLLSILILSVVIYGLECFRIKKYGMKASDDRWFRVISVISLTNLVVEDVFTFMLYHCQHQQ